MDKQILHACVFDWCCACDVIWNGLGELVLASRFSCFAAFNDGPINVILVIRHYPNLCRDTCFVTGVRNAEKYHLPQFTMLWVQWRLHLSLVSIHYGGGGGDDTGRFAGKGKLTFFESVGRTWLRQWQSTCTFTACWGRTSIWSNH